MQNTWNRSQISQGAVAKKKLLGAVRPCRFVSLFMSRFPCRRMNCSREGQCDMCAVSGNAGDLKGAFSRIEDFQALSDIDNSDMGDRVSGAFAGKEPSSCLFRHAVPVIGDLAEKSLLILVKKDMDASGPCLLEGVKESIFNQRLE